MAPREPRARGVVYAWPANTYEILTSPVAQGLVARQLVALLPPDSAGNLPSPGAVSGKCRTLGIKLPGNEKGRRRGAPNTVSVKPKKPWHFKFRTDPEKLAKPSFKHSNTASLTAFNNAIPVEQRVSLLDLTAGVCHWPVGDPGEPGFFYCGGARDPYCTQPYCRAHAVFGARRYSSY